MNGRSEAMRVVLGFDGSETAEAAVRFVAAFPFPQGTEVSLLSVVEHPLSDREMRALIPDRREVVDEVVRRRAAEVREALDAEAAVLRDAGLTASTEVRSGHAAAEIVGTADEVGADLVVVGSHGLTGFKRYLLGSVSNQVFQSSKRSVLVVRAAEHGCDGTHPEPPAPTGHPWRILVGFDGSPSSDRAVEFCSRLDLDGQMSVRLLTVLGMVRLFRQDIRQELDVVWREKKAAEQAAVEAAADRLRRQTQAEVATALVEAADVGHALLAAGDEFDADLIVLGHKGRGAVERFLMGSVTPQVVHHACRPVLVVR